MCFTPPMTFPLTCTQSMLASSSSSISPQTATFSPRIRYSPWGTSILGSGSSCGRITRSIVWLRTRFVSWSQDNKMPVRDRPSAVRTSTFSGIWDKSSASHDISWKMKGLTVDVGLKRHVLLCFQERFRWAPEAFGNSCKNPRLKTAVTLDY